MKGTAWLNQLTRRASLRYIIATDEQRGRFRSLGLGNLADRKPMKFLATEFNETQGQFSPDGSWIAYTSDETGGAAVYVRPFPDTGGKWMVSKGPGFQPRWRHDGKELFYRAPGNQFDGRRRRDQPSLSTWHAAAPVHGAALYRKWPF